MKAARLYKFGEPLSVEDVEEPALRPGSAIVRVESAFVPPFIDDVVNGKFDYVAPPLPFTPGFDTIGVVEQVANDVPGLNVGEKVYCDHVYESEGVFSPDDTCFIGAFGYGKNSYDRLVQWPDGAYAERIVLPAKCLIPLRDASHFSPALLCRLGWLGTAYGAFLKAGLRPGDTLIINGATGKVGASAVVLALALNVGRIVAIGRNKEILAELKHLNPQTIFTVSLDDTDDPNQAVMDATNGSGADIALDAIGQVQDATSTMAAYASLASGGAMALVGNSLATLPVTYKSLLDREVKLMGSNWFSRRKMFELIGLIGSGALDITVFQATTYPLNGINQAIATAGKVAGLGHIAMTN